MSATTKLDRDEIAFRVSRAAHLADAFVCAVNTNRCEEADLTSGLEILVEYLQRLSADVQTQGVE